MKFTQNQNDDGAPKFFAGVMVIAGIILLLINKYMIASEKKFYVLASLFAPPFIFIGIAGLIKKEIIQAVLRHTRNRLNLPLWSKISGWFILLIGFVVGIFLIYFTKA